MIGFTLEKGPFFQSNYSISPFFLCVVFIFVNDTDHLSGSQASLSKQEGIQCIRLLCETKWFSTR